MEELRRPRGSVFLLKASWPRPAPPRPAPRRARRRCQGDWKAAGQVCPSQSRGGDRTPCHPPPGPTRRRMGFSDLPLASGRSARPLALCPGKARPPTAVWRPASGLAPEHRVTSVTFPGCSAPSDNYFRGGPGAGLLAGEGACGCCWRVAREPEALQVGRAAAWPSERRGPRRSATVPAVGPGACLSLGLETRARLRGAKLRAHARYLPDCPATREPALVHGRRDR